MILKHLILGGPYYIAPIFMMWIVVLFFSVKFFLNYFSDKRNFEKLEKFNSIILFSGSFAFLIGIFGQLIEFYKILDIIEREGDVPFSIIAGGIGVSLLTVIYGFALLLVSTLIWFINRTLIKK